MIAATPWQGGASWAVLQYLLGLRRLGCDVYFVEPISGPADRLSESARYASETMKRIGLHDRWSLLPDSGEEELGLRRVELRDVAHSADLLLNVSGMLADEELIDPIPVRAYLDLDPAFNQLWHAVDGVDMRFDAHTHFVSVADAIGDPSCSIPDCGYEWIPTLPPVVLEQWPVADQLEWGLTTVGHWRSYGSIHHGGIHYGQKAHALRPLMGLPRRTRARFELALAIHPDEVDDLSALEEAGWILLDPRRVAATPDDYRRFVGGSWAEFGLAKLGYVVSGSGWFSDRSACYLASGRPVIAQDTGFGRRLPVGRGLLSFKSEDDVLHAVEELEHDYEGHRAAARDLAEEHLDSDRVLGSLLNRLL